MYGGVQSIFEVFNLAPPAGGLFPGRCGVQVTLPSDAAPSYRALAVICSDAGVVYSSACVRCMARLCVRGATSGDFIYRMPSRNFMIDLESCESSWMDPVSMHCRATPCFASTCRRPTAVAGLLSTAGNERPFQAQEGYLPSCIRHAPLLGMLQRSEAGSKVIRCM